MSVAGAMLSIYNMWLILYLMRAIVSTIFYSILTLLSKITMLYCTHETIIMKAVFAHSSWLKPQH